MQFEIKFKTALKNRRMRDIIRAMASIFGDYWFYELEYDLDEITAEINKVSLAKMYVEVKWFEYRVKEFIKSQREVAYDLKAVHEV